MYKGNLKSLYYMYVKQRIYRKTLRWKIIFLIKRNLKKIFEKIKKVFLNTKLFEKQKSDDKGEITQKQVKMG